MNNFNRSPSGELLCKNLRCKDMFYKAAHEPVNPNGAAHYWCTRTYETFGPDGGVADHKECLGSRECYCR